jgi:hypothetical protein
MNHDDRELDFIRRRLQSALPPSQAPEGNVDLWPRMLRRLDDPPVTFGWFEALVAAMVALAFAVFPKLLPALLYHL